MSYLLFIEESGTDKQDTPFEVLAGVAIRDSKLWGFICKLQEAEFECFGRRYSAAERAEVKGKKLLNKKTFKLAAQMPEFSAGERARLAKACLDDGETAGKRELTALGQAKLAFVERVLALCAANRVCAFASVVPRDTPRPDRTFLRKDYAFLFERFFYLLQDVSSSELGLVIHDELDIGARGRSQLLADQMSTYFRKTVNGRERSARIIPEPFFVHSDLTTAIQVADLVAYVTAWGMKLRYMTGQRRTELLAFATKVYALRHDTRRGERTISSFKLIPDLRPLEERVNRRAWEEHRAKKRKGNASSPAKPPALG